MKGLDLIKNLLIGFWEKGLIELLHVVFEHWLITSFIICIISYLCTNKDTAIAAWTLIGVFAFCTAVKALFEIVLEMRNYFNPLNLKNKSLILKNIGGKIFDFSLCIVGVFQVLKIFSHISKITKTSSSVISFVDDAASAASKILKDIAK